MHGELIGYERRGSLAVLTLNRPDKLNAINSAMIDGLGQALTTAEADEDVRVIVLAGAGRAFSSGFDLDMETGDGRPDPLAVRAALERDFRIIMRFWDSPKVTIAAVHRYCLGSAMELALACDLTVAADDCVFGAPEVRFGSGIVAMLLPWLAGPKRAKQLLLTGEDRLPAAQALAMGLVSQVVPADRLMDEALELGRRIAANDRIAVALTKQAINRSLDVAGLRQALLQALELDVIVETTETAESREFNAILRRDGAKAAVAWRRAQSRKARRRGDNHDRGERRSCTTSCGSFPRAISADAGPRTAATRHDGRAARQAGRATAEFAKPFKEGVNFCGATVLLDSKGQTFERIDNGGRDGDPDVISTAVPGSLAPVPWAQVPTAQVLLAMASATAEPFFADPRQVLRQCGSAACRSWG